MEDRVLFFDTNALINLQEKVLIEPFVVSSVTVKELEAIKVSETKSSDVKFKARKALHLLDKYSDRYSVVTYKNSFNRILKKLDLPDSPDNRIIASAVAETKKYKNLVFVTYDLACRMIAKNIAGLNTDYDFPIEEEYEGFKIVNLSDEGLDNFYKAVNNNSNIFGLLENQYIIIRYQGEIVDKFKWAKEKYEKIPFYELNSKYFGKIKPRDIYQTFALDSLFTNQVTTIAGGAGCGKSLLALAYLFDKLERGEIDKILIFSNPVAARGSARLGFTPGSLLDKLLDSQAGAMLVAKLGDRLEIERLVEEGQLLILPFSNLRGFDTSGMNAGVYITEAQDTDAQMMQLALQRIGEDTKVVIEGDYETQTDLSLYEGDTNGLKKLINVFKGHDLYGHVKLQKCERSRVAEIAEKMF